MICGFLNGDNCYVGIFIKYVKSDFNSRFDLAYIETFKGELIIGLKSDLLYSQQKLF